LNAILDFEKIPTLEGLQKYIEMGTFPGGLFKNFKGYKDQASDLTEMQKYVLCDPQTSGGLLVAVDASKKDEVVSFMKSVNHAFYEIGHLTKEENSRIVNVV
jgi:selenide,water dikinase